LFARGWNVVQVSKTLGYATPDFTMRVYLHDLDPDLPASPFDPPRISEVSAENGRDRHRRRSTVRLNQAEEPGQPETGRGGGDDIRGSGFGSVLRR
jgi:hypothetical protein